MKGDQLARQWRVIRAIEASPGGLTVAEIAKREETGIRTIYRDLEAQHLRYHAKAQRAPSEIFKILFPPLKIFIMLQHSRTILCVFCVLARDKIPRRAAKFAKKKVLNFLTIEKNLFQFLSCISQEKKDLCVLCVLA
jgi:predicted DNA-binding transcriptional regulator YafY